MAVISSYLPLFFVYRERNPVAMTPPKVSAWREVKVFTIFEQRSFLFLLQLTPCPLWQGLFSEFNTSNPCSDRAREPRHGRPPSFKASTCPSAAVSLSFVLTLITLSQCFEQNSSVLRMLSYLHSCMAMAEPELCVKQCLNKKCTGKNSPSQQPINWGFTK